MCVFFSLSARGVYYTRVVVRTHTCKSLSIAYRARLYLFRAALAPRAISVLWLLSRAVDSVCMCMCVCIGCAHDCFIGLALYGGTTLSLELLALIFRVFFSLRDRLLGNFGTNLDHRSLL